jgi:hypothetical protein
MDDAKYEYKEIQEKLIGFKITEAIISPDGESFGFKAIKGKKEVLVWVDRDPEGNGCGHLEIQDK